MMIDEDYLWLMNDANRVSWSLLIVWNGEWCLMVLNDGPSRLMMVHDSFFDA